MIQRIQSIYLLLAAVLVLVGCLMPLATASGDATALAATGDNFFADGVYRTTEFPAGWLFLSVVGMIGLTIFRYQNRTKQMFSVSLLIIFTALCIILLGSLGYYYAQRLPEGTMAQLAPGGAVWPVSIVFLLLANRAIKKDEALVRSSDRLR
jgi:hypothetical protein